MSLHNPEEPDLLKSPELSSWLRRSAASSPEKVALETEARSWTYAQLLAEVSSLSQDLQRRGLQPGDRIGIAATRSAETIVSILAAVDARVAYVPLDLLYPPPRLRAMVDRAQPRLVMGEESALQELERLIGKFPRLEEPAPRTAKMFGAAPDLTYVLFTSGSTGEPKGVAMGALPLASLIHWHAQHARLGQPAKVLQFAPLSFDVHFQEIFSTLACAGTLVLVPESQRRDPDQLLTAIKRFSVARIFMPYVALQMLADAAKDDAPATLRDVVSAGEQLQVTPAIRALFQGLPGAELHNHYGPTESHVCTAHELRGDPAHWPEIPPIGVALPHVQLALYNRMASDDGAPGSTTGELLLGGETLAHGYLGRPELSAERFRTDFDRLPGRWYVTGDLVRRDAQGVCTYLGRVDQQLKVDGFRIEAGEIELAIMAHAAVKDAVVTAPELAGAGKQLVAHLVLRDPKADASPLITELRAHLRRNLPEYMVPVRFVTLDQLPTTPSGKIDRLGLPLPVVESTATASAPPLELTRTLWQELLGLPQIGDDQNLFDLGARSLLVMRFIARLKELEVKGVTVADVYDRPTVAGIAAAMAGTGGATKRSRNTATQATSGIAIVGMATRVPGSTDVQSFWNQLMAGHEGIRHFALSEVDPSIPESVRSRPNFVAAHGVLDNVEQFDAAYFGISAREATMLDPQQRLMLELCTSALEHAAIDPSREDLRVGVYAGTGNNAYAPALREAQPELVRQYGEFATMLASEKDYVATRVANKLNLHGPALSIHTACSTSLVAVAQAWHGLASGQCDMALAGGVNVVVPQHCGYLHVEGGMESADGHCRPFDADASGTVFASGGGVVVLKRLEDAQADGDTIYGVIRGVGLNNDGGDKASFTAPSVTGQAEAIRMALEHAQCNARSIGYVEAHGTGTSLGDPIEVAALTRAWREDTADNQFCGIGSVKSNLGHMAAGAGVVGLIKATLALHEQTIPGTLHYRRPNPQIDFETTPFTVVAQNTAWPRGKAVRRAAVSSFGVGGTNAHVVIEEAPAREHTAASQPSARQLLPLSGRTAEATLQRALDLAEHLESHPEIVLADVAATLMRGRKPMNQRLSVVADSVASAVAALRSVKTASPALTKPRLVFLFPGQGSQHPGMARQLYDEATAFREALDRCLAIAAPALGGVDFRHWLITADPADGTLSQTLAETRYAQPALFSVSYALAAWLDSLGLQPDAMIGHSIGEYAAACHAGVFTVEQAMTAVIARGQAMFEQPRGAMMAVRTSAEAVRALLPQGIEIAGCNAPTLTVVAGSHEAIDAFSTALEAKDIGTTKLRVSHAFHSASMDGALPGVELALKGASLKPPSGIVYSCISGAPLQASEATDPHYWARQVRAPVQFSTAVSTELALGDTVFVEVGPGQALTALLRQHRTEAGKVPRHAALLGTSQDPGNPAHSALAGLGALWCAGVPVAWPVAASARRLALPTYPFKGDRYWFKRQAATTGTALNTPVSIAAAAPADAAMSLQLQTEPTVTTMSRIPNLESELKRVLNDVSGLSADELTNDATFVDLGLDSLSLTQATLELERVFGVKLRFRRLLEDLNTVSKLAQFLDGEMPADKFAPTQAPMSVTAPAQVTTQLAPSIGNATAMADGDVLHQLVQQQLELMSQQLALLSGQPFKPSATQPAFAPPPALPPPPTSIPATAPTTDPDPALTRTALVDKPFGASPRLTLQANKDFTPEQAKWLDDFIARSNSRSGKSKAFSQQHRKLMADPRVVTGFNPLWKDLVYPIVVDRSAGASLWDLDGNEYIDLLSCFGGNLLGYQAPDVIEAMSKQLQLGLEVGPQHPMAAEVAQLIAEFTGMERVGFCNTGSEAVMGAMRIARTVTGRKTIAIFNNSYHGIFDEVIVRGTKQLRSLSAAPGILANTVENILVLDWNSEDSLRVLRERGSELAAIMTEPIQNKYPTVQPREFVQALREIADKSGCALIFDEVVTGFRVSPGGAQEFYSVRADIATYGKVIGGGLPFAAIAGNAKWLDALDGGQWQYGDDSYPEAGVTYFAGTFVRHPLALAAARATLLHLKAGGREFYRQLNDRTQRLIDRLNRAFALRSAPVKAVHCASIWRLSWDDNQKFVSLFYYLVRYHGLHLYEQFGHFVTEAMTDAHIDRIFEVFTAALDELMALGFILPKDGGPAPGGSDSGPKGDGRAPTQAALSPGQTERWLAGGFDASARRALNESFCVSLSGPVDMDALKLALQDVLMRHDAFRVRFALDEPRQTLAPPAPVHVHEVDLRSQADADTALDSFCTHASRSDFPIDQAPLAAVSLLSLADGRVVVHMVASHLVLDGWASSVFNAELAAAYKARSTGLLPQFKPAESPLRFAEEEQARFNGPEGQDALAFWQKQLTNPPAPLTLGDRTPSAPRQYSADTLRVRLDGDLFARLRSQARQSGGTLFQVLLTAVTLMLQKRSGQSDFVISIPYASQSLQCRGPLMADGVLDLPVRLNCGNNAEPAEVLHLVRTRLMDALEYPLMTQGTVARALGIRSAGDRPPLTGIYFNLNPKVDLSAYAPLVATMHEGRKAGTLSELFFNFYEQQDALTLDLHYSSEFFSPTRAQELTDALIQECHRIAKTGQMAPRTMTSSPFIHEQERTLATQHLTSEASTAPGLATTPAESVTLDPRLIAWNAKTARPQEPHGRVEQWIARQAAATPKAVALIAQGKTLSYQALEARANRFGNLLKSRGIGAGMLVGVCLTRGPDLVPSLLGVLKTGAAYVPLDPGFPKDRLRYMAEDAGVRIVITDAANAALSGVPRDQQLRIDDDAALLAAAAETPLSVQSEWADDAAMYVIYTSGSTGKPKGVVLPQSAVCNFLASMRREPGLRTGDRLLAVTTLSFDIAVLELFLPLITGATVILAQREEAMDPEVLARLMTEQHVNVMQATPTTWHMLLDTAWQAPASFRALCGGEPLPPALAERLLVAGVELWNMYGPTETTVWSTLCRITDPKQKITIGHPIDNTQVWVLDHQMKPCAIGKEGELCIGGAGVATGYFKRPDLTAEKFIPDPFNTAPGARIYRTGDLARWREDGALEHLGRLDFQIKIRGYRIELGEVEARLASLPGIGRTVVMAREDSPGDVRLVGYAVPQTGHTPDTAHLRESLRSDLPDYMLPQQIVLLDALPLLPNGKIDRKSLPVPSTADALPVSEGRLPRNELESQLAAAMASVLKLQAVSIDDDFFSLGGHSLLAARLIGQINRELGLQLALRTLFESPSVEGLATVVALARGADAAPPRAPILHRQQQDTAPLTLMQERINFVERMQPGRLVYHAPSGHRLRGPMDVHAFDRAFREVVQRQDAFRTAIVATADGFVQRVQEELSLSLLPLTDLSNLPEHEQESALLDDMNRLTATLFALDHAPLIRTRLYKLADDHHALFLMAHHILWDGWSFDIFYTEMAAHYQAFLQGLPSPLPPLQVSYGDFAAWHSAWMQSDEIREQTEYWKRQLGDPMPRAEAHADMPRPQISSGMAATEHIDFDASMVGDLQNLARRTGSTTSIVLLAAYAALMSQWMDEPMPTIGLPVRGRPAPELEGVMGFFNNMLPLRLKVTMSMSMIDWVLQVRKLVTDAIANQDVPFERISQELNLPAGAIYQALFNFQDVRARQTRWGDLQHERIHVPLDGASEDMNLWLVEGESGISGGFKYDPDVFLPSSVAALRDRFARLLSAGTQNAEQTLATLLAPDAAELAAVTAWETQHADVALGNICGLVEKHWTSRPTCTAMRADDRSWTGDQLIRELSRVRVALESNVNNERGLVVVATDDPFYQVVVLLAAAQAAVTLCTLAGNDPGLRVAFARPDLALAIGGTNQASSWPTHIPRMVLDTTETATPHGTLVEQQALPILGGGDFNALLNGLSAEVNAGPSDIWLCSIDSDRPLFAFLQACASLTAGAGVVFDASTAQGKTTDLGSLIREQQLTILHAPAAAWDRWLASHDQTTQAGTKAVIDVAVATRTRVDSLRAAGFCVFNVYREAELGLPLAAGLLNDSDEAAVFGRPLQAGHLKVTDASGNQTAPGTPGEMQARSIGTDAHWQATGTRARWRSDGRLQHLSGFKGLSFTARPIEITGAEQTSTPMSPLEREMHALWVELLGQPDIGLDDSFFDLGGYSLLAMGLIEKIESRFGKKIQPASLLEAPTIRRLCVLVEHRKGKNSLLTLRPGNGGSGIFFIHDIDGEVLLYRNLAMRLDPRHPIYALRPHGDDETPILHTRISEMAEHYVQQIQSAQPFGPYILAGLCAGGDIAFEVACRLQAKGERIGALVLMESAHASATVRPLLRSQRRFGSLSQALRNHEPDKNFLVHTARAAATLVRKAMSVIRYEWDSRITSIRLEAQLRKLRASLDNGVHPRRGSHQLTVRQIISFAQRTAGTHGHLTGNALLLRARKGDGTEGDQPFVEVFADPLFGWADSVEGKVIVADVDGGHSSMLQEPFVASTHAALEAYINNTLDTHRAFPTKQATKAVSPLVNAPIKSEA